MKALDNAEVHIIKGMVLICFLTHQQVGPQLWCFWIWLRVVELLFISISDRHQVATVLSWAYGYGLQEIQSGEIDSVCIPTSFESQYGQDIFHKNHPDRLRGPPSLIFNEYWVWVISGFAAKLLGTAPFGVITQRIVLISYRRFGTTYQYHHEGSKDSGILRMWLIGCSERLVRNYDYRLRNNSEKRSSRGRGFFPKEKAAWVWCWPITFTWYRG